MTFFAQGLFEEFAVSVGGLMRHKPDGPLGLIGRRNQLSHSVQQLA